MNLITKNNFKHLTRLNHLKRVLMSFKKDNKHLNRIYTSEN